jgi:hypothetical protein
MSDNQKDTMNPEERKMKKPLNPLAQKPGQNYGSTKFKEKPQIEVDKK